MDSNKTTTTIINRVSPIINRATHPFMHNNNSYSKGITIRERTKHSRITITPHLDRKAQVIARPTLNKGSAQYHIIIIIIIIIPMMKVNIQHISKLVLNHVIEIDDKMRQIMT